MSASSGGTAPVGGASFCGSCGEPVATADKFCRECGAAVLGEPVEAQEPRIERETTPGGPAQPPSGSGFLQGEGDPAQPATAEPSRSSWIAFFRARPLALEAAVLVVLFLLAIDALGADVGESSSSQIWVSLILTLALSTGIWVQAISWMRSPRRQVAGRAVMLLAACDLIMIGTVAGHAGSPVVQVIVALAALSGAVVGLAAAAGRRATRLLLIVERLMVRLGGRLLLSAILDGIRMGLGAVRISGELGGRGADNLDKSFKNAEARRQDFETQKKAKVAAIKKARGDVWHD